MKNRSVLWLFLIGLGSITQFHFVGSLGLSELPIFLLAPFLFIIDYRKLKEDGFLPFVWLSIATCLGCCVSSYCNHTPVIFFIKGLAHPYAIFASTVVLHRVLRGNYDGIKWYFIGVFLSGIICVFVFQPETYTVSGGSIATGDVAAKRVMENALFWTSRIKALLTLPIMGFYLSTPQWYNVSSPIIVAVVALFFSSGSGRAIALVSVMSALFIYVGGKRRRRMARIGRHLIGFGIIMIVVLIAFKIVYSSLAKTGALGYEAQDKYEKQTRTGNSAMRILMSGRMELFCGVMACLDHPIIGFGPRAEDTGGYTERYLREYGDQQDYENFVGSLYEVRSDGDRPYVTIPAHSHIAMFWVYYGIIGLVLWLYVIWQFYMMFRKGWIAAIPQCYGYMSLAIAITSWDILFSPFSARIGFPLLMSMVLFSRAIKEGKMCLPYEMEMEARKYD